MLSVHVDWTRSRSRRERRLRPPVAPGHSCRRFVDARRAGAARLDFCRPQASGVAAGCQHGCGRQQLAAQQFEDGMNDPPAHPGSVARARGFVRQDRRLQWLLVHVRADRKAYRKRPGQENKAAFHEVVRRGPPPRFTGLRRRRGRGLMPANTARCRAVARSRVAAQARGRGAGLVTLLHLCAQRLSPAGRHVSTDPSGVEATKAARAPALEAYPFDARRVAERFGLRLCLDLRPRRVQDRGTPHSGSPDHAPRSEGDRSIRAGGRARKDRGANSSVITI